MSPLAAQKHREMHTKESEMGNLQALVQSNIWGELFPILYFLLSDFDNLLLLRAKKIKIREQIF